VLARPPRESLARERPSFKPMPSGGFAMVLRRSFPALFIFDVADSIRVQDLPTLPRGRMAQTFWLLLYQNHSPQPYFEAERREGE